MIDIYRKDYQPALDEIGEFVNNPVFLQFCGELERRYHVVPKIEFSSCSWEPGWNVKFKKSGKNLCTVYPRENYFTVLVVIGTKEKEAAESILEELTPELQELYSHTQAGNGQKWLMIPLEDCDQMYSDVLRLIDIRRR